MRVAFTSDAATSVVLPGGEPIDGDVDGWARQAADELAGRHDSTVVDPAVLAEVLAHAQRRAVDDPSRNLLVFEPTTVTWTSARFTLLERELTADEQTRFLRPEAILPPRLRLFASRGLGLGCSATVMEQDGRGTVRWLFVVPGVSFFAALGPVPAPAVVASAAIVEDILNTVLIDGIARRATEGFDAAAHVFPNRPEGVAWRI